MEWLFFCIKRRRSGPKGGDYWFSRIVDSSHTCVGGVLKEQSHCYFFVAVINQFLSKRCKLAEQTSSSYNCNEILKKEERDIFKARDFI